MKSILNNVQSSHRISPVNGVPPTPSKKNGHSGLRLTPVGPPLASHPSRLFAILAAAQIRPNLVLEQAVEEKSPAEKSALETHRQGDTNVKLALAWRWASQNRPRRRQHYHRRH